MEPKLTWIQEPLALDDVRLSKLAKRLGLFVVRARTAVILGDKHPLVVCIRKNI
jgi:hypothetical protein